MPTNQTGEYAEILEWFRINPDTIFTTKEIAEAFSISMAKAGNALGWWTRKNLLIRGETRGSFRLRKDTEIREEFKVARITPKEPKTAAIIQLPILTEIDPQKMTPIVKRIINSQFSTAAQNDRLQYVDPNTFIVWNSSVQRTNMRRKSLEL